jgi:hypothetical protein
MMYHHDSNHDAHSHGCTHENHSDCHAYFFWNSWIFYHMTFLIYLQRKGGRLKGKYLRVIQISNVQLSRKELYGME